MTNYDKIKKAVFLSDGRCVFEDDYPVLVDGRNGSSTPNIHEPERWVDNIKAGNWYIPTINPDKTTSGYFNWKLPWTQETQKKIDEKLAINRLYWNKLYNEECNKQLRTLYQPYTYTVAKSITSDIVPDAQESINKIKAAYTTTYKIIPDERLKPFEGYFTVEQPTQRGSEE